MWASRGRRPHTIHCRGCSRLPKTRALHNLKPAEPFKILFFGNNTFSCLVLDELFKNRGKRKDVWQGIWIATRADVLTSRNRKSLAESPLKLRALELGLPVHLLPPRSEFKHWQPPSPVVSSVPSPDPRTLLVTASFGYIIPDALLHAFAPSRRLNVHPSLLPLYRGPAPIQHALMDGREETGVCVIEMKEKRKGIDAGEIWAKKEIPIPPKSEFQALRKILGVVGGRLLVSTLREMIAGTAVAVPQDDSHATHAPMIRHSTAHVDFNKWNARKLERMHRAIAYKRPLWTTLPDPESKTVQLHSPFPVPEPSHSTVLYLLKHPGDMTYDPRARILIVRCADGTFAAVPRVKQQDRALLSAREWWNGILWKDWVRDGVLRLGAGVVGEVESSK